MLGHSIFGEGKRAKTMPVVNALVVGFTVTVINGILNYRQYSDKYIADGMARISKEDFKQYYCKKI